MKYVMAISSVCILLCVASCQHTESNLPGGRAVVTGTITSFSALTRQKGETRYALRLTNAVVTEGKFDLAACTLPAQFGNQHWFVVEWCDAFQIAGQKGIRVQGCECCIHMQSNRVLKVTGDWEKD